MKRRSAWLVVFGCWFVMSGAYAQSDIPIGTWRLHLSYNAVESVALGDNKVYGASASGVLVYDGMDNSISTYNTLNGLSSTGITCIAYDAARGQLLIAYEDGDLDILQDQTVTNFNRLRNSSDIAGSKKINHIAINGTFGYLSTDYGVVVFDLERLELKETWRDLGPVGEVLAINAAAFSSDSVFVATENGVIGGDLHDNLLDFHNWKRFNTGDLSSGVQSIAQFEGVFYAAVNGKGIYQYHNGGWTRQGFLQDQEFHSLHASSSLLITASSGLWRVNAAGDALKIEDIHLSSPLAAVMDEQQHLWVGDRTHGLVSDKDGSFTSYLPNGPSVVSAFRLRTHLRGDHAVLTALPGGFGAEGKPLEHSGILQQFEDGQWQSEQRPLNDLTDFETIGSVTYASSFGDGIEKSEAGSHVVFDHTNSPLQNLEPAGRAVNITAMRSFGDELWVANYGASNPLHVLKNGQWRSVALCCQARYPVAITIDPWKNIWMTISPQQGGGLHVYNPETNLSVYRSEVTGTGALPHRNVHAVAVDRDGYVWAGTDQGVAYFISPESDAVKPIFDNRFLLRDEKVTAIAVDGGNRKWIGTHRGVWLVNASGEELIASFNTANSPLLSDTVRDIAINDLSGEVFFATSRGIISYRADATAGAEDFETVKIFPNPVTSAFSGTVGISGLATDAVVKITDVSGKLIWQAQAYGGTATWNVRDLQGRRAATGIYVVFAAKADGSKSAVGKIAVVE